ncbi:MAG: hypothetical protein ABSB65_07340, partial [Candidatus Acidiferrales bacterium]
MQNVPTAFRRARMPIDTRKTRALSSTIPRLSNGHLICCAIAFAIWAPQSFAQAAQPSTQAAPSASPAEQSARENFFKRLWRAYKDDWKGAASSGPEPP